MKTLNKKFVFSSLLSAFFASICLFVMMGNVVYARAGFKPIVSAVSPVQGSTAGGTAILITGGWWNVSPAATVSINGKNCPVTYIDVTYISCETPANIAGTYQVIVTDTTDGASAVTKSFTYVQPAPTVTGFTPKSGALGGGTSVVVTGTGFTGATSVKFDTINAQSFTVNSDTKITAVSPAHAAGVVDVYVTTPGGAASSILDKFTYKGDPVISALESVTFCSGTPSVCNNKFFPSWDTGVSSFLLYINGSNFDYPSSPAVTIGGVSVPVVSGDSSDSQVAVTVPSGWGTDVVKVTNADGKSVSMNLTYSSSLHSLSPASGAVGSTVVLVGKHLPYASAVKFNGTPISYTVNAQNYLVITVPSGTGTVPVSVQDTMSGLYSTVNFTYTAPAVPSKIINVSFYGSGSGKVVGSAPSIINCHTGSSANCTDTINPGTTYVELTPVADSGYTFSGWFGSDMGGMTSWGQNGDILQLTGSGTANVVANFSSASSSANPPNIVGLYPSIIWTTGGEITLNNGSGFTGATSVKCGTSNADYFSVNNDTNLSLRCPAHAAGPVPVSVTTPAGTDTINQLWYVEEHFVTNLTPTTGPAAGGTAIVITGTGLTNVFNLKFDNDLATFTVVNDSLITATSPAHAAGTVNVTLEKHLPSDPNAPIKKTISTFTYTVESVPVPSAGPVISSYVFGDGATVSNPYINVTGTGFVNSPDAKVYVADLSGNVSEISDSDVDFDPPNLLHIMSGLDCSTTKSFFIKNYPGTASEVTSNIYTFDCSSFSVAPPAITVPSIGNNTTCYDVRFTGKGVAIDNVHNSGILDFEGSIPSQDYALCVEDPDNNGAAPFYLAGWSWNNNLGYVSFYCKSGNNRGAPCGSIDYGAWIDADGKFHGYAWGDNVGWIQFDNSPYAQLRLEVNDESCQGYVYGNTVPTAPGTSTPMNCNITPKHGSSVAEGNEWTHIWADSVGWIDLDSTLFPWYTLVKKIVIDDIDPCFQLMTDGTYPAGNKCPGPIPPEPDPRTDPSGSSTPVAATPRPSCPSDPSDSTTNTSIVPTSIPKSGDGTDNYWQFKVKIKDRIDCNPITPDRYEVHAQFSWTDTVKTDQITPGLTLDNSNCSRPFSTDPLVAVKKDCGDVILNYNPTTKTYDAPPVYSLAPTSNANGVYLGGGLGFYPFEKFSLPPKTQVEEGKLILHDIKLYVLDTHLQPTDPAHCVFPGPMAFCTGQSLTGRNGFGGNYNFTFRPRTKITSLEQSTNGGLPNTINMPVAVKVDFSSQVEGTGNITYFAGLEPFTSVFRMGFTSADEFDYASLASSGTNGPFSGSKILNLGMSLNPAVSGLGTSAQYSGGLYLYSEVSETLGGKPVRYYSNKLPRMVGSTGILPVAVLIGNVYSTGIATPTSTSAALRSLGDVSTNVLRDQIFKSVQKIIAGITLQPGNGLSTITALDAFADSTDNTNDIKVLLEGKVLYSKGDVHLSSISWTGEKTLIVIGGSVYIDDDLYPVTPVGQSRPRLGIISLKDITKPANTQMKAGNVYIDADVNNIQANIFADGSVFSYDKSKSPSVNTFGEPIFANIQEQNTILRKNQLFIEGSVASQNTVGGADNSPMIKGDGTNATDRFQAQLYDFNYLRQYVGELRRDGSGNVCKGNEGLGTISTCSVINDVSIQYLDLSGLPYSAAEGGVLYPPMGGTPADGLDPNKDLGSTYISFDPPPPTLPGFAYDAGVETKYRVK